MRPASLGRAVSRDRDRCIFWMSLQIETPRKGAMSVDTGAYASTHQHTSAYVSIRQRMLYVVLSVQIETPRKGAMSVDAQVHHIFLEILQHTLRRMLTYADVC